MKTTSDEYKATLQQGHATYDQFGVTGHRFLNNVLELVREFHCESILDYGCGKGTLRAPVLAALPNIDFREYDPGILGKDAAPEPADLVCAFDCLEHVEPAFLDLTIGHLRSLTRKVLAVAIPTKYSAYFLPDGRNAHLIVRPQIWWMMKLMAHFELQMFWRNRLQVQFYAVFLDPEFAWSFGKYKAAAPIYAKQFMAGQFPVTVIDDIDDHDDGRP